MDNTTKMPGAGGFDIKVVRKEDILECIDANILDKELMKEFISQFEIDANNFLTQGRWTALPYMGSLRKNQFKEKIRTPEMKQLIADAKETLDNHSYYLFRRSLDADICREIKNERVFKYILSQFVRKNRDFYEYLMKTKGESYARVIGYSLFDVKTYAV